MDSLSFGTGPMRLPPSLLAALAALLLVALALRGCGREESPRAPDRAPLEARLDSLLRASRADAESLVAYASEVRRLRGDSLRLALVRRAASRRPALVARGLLPPAESLATPEAQQEAAAQTLLLSDSACRVEADSLRRAVQGCEAERAVEVEEAARSIQEAEQATRRAERASTARAARWGLLGACAGAVGALLLVGVAGD